MNESKNKALKGLKSIVFNNASLFFDQLVEIFAVTGQCGCLQKDREGKIVCTKCHTSDRKIAVIILVRLGLDHPEAQYLTILSEMMTWRWFRGLIGGKPQKALYFVGMKEDEYVYLDPHYVQSANEDITENKNSYFC